jgi:hypothetical protein
MTIWIEKDATDNKRMQLEMKKNVVDSSSSAMLMVTRDLMCAEVVVEKQQTHIHQIQNITFITIFFFFFFLP